MQSHHIISMKLTGNISEQQETNISHTHDKNKSLKAEQCQAFRLVTPTSCWCNSLIFTWTSIKMTTVTVRNHQQLFLGNEARNDVLTVQQSKLLTSQICTDRQNAQGHVSQQSESHIIFRIFCTMDKYSFMTAYCIQTPWSKHKKQIKLLSILSDNASVLKTTIDLYLY